MSILPLFLNELLEEADPVSNGIYDHDYYGLRRRHVPSKLSLLSVPLSSGYLRPWRVAPPKRSGVSNVHHDRKGFKIMLDTQQFKPEELKIKVVDGFLVVDGKHDERIDEHGFIARQFSRRYKLPGDIDDSKIESNISSDGVLTVEAPAKNMLPAIFYQDIPIVQTNLPAASAAGIPSVKKMKEEKSLLPYYKNIPIIETNEPAKKSNSEEAKKGEAMETEK